jgi:hypothetical protein
MEGMSTRIIIDSLLGISELPYEDGSLENNSLAIEVQRFKYQALLKILSLTFWKTITALTGIALTVVYRASIVYWIVAEDVVVVVIGVIGGILSNGWLGQRITRSLQIRVPCTIPWSLFVSFGLDKPFYLRGGYFKERRILAMLGCVKIACGTQIPSRGRARHSPIRNYRTFSTFLIQSLRRSRRFFQLACRRTSTPRCIDGARARGWLGDFDVWWPVAPPCRW